jgi:hypothetical protein
MPRTRRVVSILCLVAFLAVPLMAQSEREPAIPFLGFLSALWERLTEPSSGAASVWEADETPTQQTPAPGSSGRGGWDPNG